MNTPQHNPSADEGLVGAVDRLVKATERALYVMEWLEDNSPDCFGWEPPFPSTKPSIAVEAEKLAVALAAARSHGGM